MRETSHSRRAFLAALGTVALAGARRRVAAQTPPGQLPPGHPPLSQTPPGPAPPGTLPPGHPSAGSLPGQPAVPPPPPTSDTGPRALGWTIPKGWVSETPGSAMRRAQYRVPGPGGDGECLVFYFGPGQGGDATANVNRWAEQFKQPDGRPSSQLLKTRKLEVGGVPVLLAEVTGTYGVGMAMGGGSPQPERPGYMLLGAVAQGPDANWFFKLTGPKTTVDAQRPAFEAMVKSLRKGR